MLSEIWNLKHDLSTLLANKRLSNLALVHYRFSILAKTQKCQPISVNQRSRIEQEVQARMSSGSITFVWPNYFVAGRDQGGDIDWRVPEYGYRDWADRYPR